MVARDGHLFARDVAGQVDALHAVEERPGDGIELVGGAHEQHLGQIERQVQVMVEEIGVLLGIQHFEERRGGIAAERCADLVDFVEHDDRVGHPGLLDGLDELAGHGADVGAAVALDFGLVAHAAQAEAVELAAQRLGDGPADGCLAHPRRSDEQEDRTADLALVGAHGEKFDDAFLDVVEAVVVAIQDLPRPLQVQLVLGVPAPGQRRHPVQVVAGDAVFGRTELQDGHLVELVVDAFLRHLGERDALEAALETLQFRRPVVLRDAQFLLDLAELLLEEELALFLGHALLDAFADVRLQARHL